MRHASDNPQLYVHNTACTGITPEQCFFLAFRSSACLFKCLVTLFDFSCARSVFAFATHRRTKCLRAASTEWAKRLLKGGYLHRPYLRAIVHACNANTFAIEIVCAERTTAKCRARSGLSQDDHSATLPTKPMDF